MMIEHLQKFSPEEIEQFLVSRDPKSLDIPPKLAEYILQINAASNLLKEHKYISECAKQLQELYPKLSIPTCKSRIYDSIKYFNHASNVTSDEWNRYFADQMMELYQKNMDGGDFREARLCLEKALEYNLAASAGAINPDRIKFKPQIVSPDIELERMGVKKKGLMNAYFKGAEIINSSDANETEKLRLFGELKQELNVQDIDYEEK
jgi:hypothetical protein